MATMVGAVPTVEQKEELFDPLAPADVDKSDFNPLVTITSLFFSISRTLFLGFVCILILVPLNLIARLNAVYLSIHGNAILGRPMWLKASGYPQPA